MHQCLRPVTWCCHCLIVLLRGGVELSWAHPARHAAAAPQGPVEGMSVVDVHFRVLDDAEHVYRVPMDMAQEGWHYARTRPAEEKTGY